MSFIIIVMLWLPPVVRVGGVSKVETFADSMPAVPPAAPLPCSLTAFPAYCSCSKVQVLHSFFFAVSHFVVAALFFLFFTSHHAIYFILFAYFFLAAISQVFNAFVLLFLRRFRLAAPAAPKRRLHSHSHSLSACLS